MFSWYYLFIKNFKVFYRPHLITAILTMLGMTASEQEIVGPEAERLMMEQGKNHFAAFSLLFPTGFLQSCEDPTTISCQLSLLFLGPWLPEAGWANVGFILF